MGIWLARVLAAILLLALGSGHEVHTSCEPDAGNEAAEVFRDWHGVTAFAVLEQLAEGREQAAVAFMRWARERGFNVVRVFTMAPRLLGLSAADGVAAVPRLLRLAADLDLTVELVAFADTRSLDLDLEAHVDGIARAIAGAKNVVVELANENDHRTQDPRLTDPARLQALRKRLPADVPVSLGSLHGGDMRVGRYGGGDYVTIHLPRSLPPWDHVGATARLADLARQAGKPVVSDEPIGAGERVERRRRWTNPAVFFGLGLMGRMSGVPATFHCEDCLYAKVPGPTQQACATAFIEGARLLPEGRRFSLVPVSGMLRQATLPGVTAIHAAEDETGEWTVVAALGAPPRLVLPWAEGWTGKVIARKGRVTVFRAVRAPSPARGR